MSNIHFEPLPERSAAEMAAIRSTVPICSNCGEPREAHGRLDACPTRGTQYSAARSVPRSEWPMPKPRAEIKIPPIPAPRDPRKHSRRQQIGKCVRGAGGAGGWNKRLDVTIEGVVARWKQGRTNVQIMREFDCSAKLIATLLRKHRAVVEQMKRCACGGRKATWAATCFACKQREGE